MGMGNDIRIHPPNNDNFQQFNQVKSNETQTNFSTHLYPVFSLLSKQKQTGQTTLQNGGNVPPSP
jgi:hypothetical protein